MPKRRRSRPNTGSKRRRGRTGTPAGKRPRPLRSSSKGRGIGRKRLTRGSKPRARSSIKKRLKAVEKAIGTLGERNVRRGPQVLGKTRPITPTRSGFNVVSKVLDEINKVSRLGKKKLFTYDLEGSYRAPDGRRKRFTLKGVGIPRLGDVKRKPGESQRAALNRVVRARITREVHTILRKKLKGTSPPGPFQGRKISKAAAEKALRGFKKSRGVKFSVVFKREI